VPTQPSIQWEPGAIIPVVKWPGHDADHSHSSNAEIKNCRAIFPLSHLSSCYSALPFLILMYVFLYRFRTHRHSASLAVAIYTVGSWDGLRWHDTHTNFQDTRFTLSNNIKVITGTIWKTVVSVLLMRGIYKYATAVGSDTMMYTSNFIKTAGRSPVRIPDELDFLQFT
jgi:hypothetical protein